MFAWKVAMTTFEKIGVLYEVLKVSIFFCSNKYMARWLNWLERPVHTREVESSSLSLATIQACGHGSQAFCYIIKT